MKTMYCAAVALVLGTAPMVSAQQACLPMDKILEGGDRLPAAIEVDGTELSLNIGRFWEMGNPPTPATGGFTEVDKPECTGTDLAFRLAKQTLVVEHVGGDATESISIMFCDFGGHENVSANREQPPKFVDDVRRVSGEILTDDDGDEVEMRVQVTRVIRNSANVVRGYEGTLRYNAQKPLRMAQFGGEELFITHICTG